MEVDFFSSCEYQTHFRWKKWHIPFPRGTAVHLCELGAVLNAGGKWEPLQECFHCINSTKLQLFGLGGRNWLMLGWMGLWEAADSEVEWDKSHQWFLWVHLGFFWLCRDTPCIASQLWWEKAAGGAGALQEHCPSQACREFRGQFFGRPQKWNGGIWGVSWEPFTIWTFSRWALRLCQQSQRGCLLPLPSQGMGNHSVFSSSELNCDVLPWSVPIFLKDLPNEGESKICKFDKQESGTGRQSVLENGWNHLEKENGRTNECKVPLLGCSNRWQ